MAKNDRFPRNEAEGDDVHQLVMRLSEIAAFLGVKFTPDDEKIKLFRRGTTQSSRLHNENEEHSSTLTDQNR